jgi:hypothetical protein
VKLIFRDTVYSGTPKPTRKVTASVFAPEEHDAQQYRLPCMTLLERYSGEEERWKLDSETWGLLAPYTETQAIRHAINVLDRVFTDGGEGHD